MSHKLIDFERQYETLQECLISITELLHQVREVEGLSEYIINLEHRDDDGSVRNINNTSFTVPYPYIAPVSPELKRQYARNKKVIPRDVFQSWVSQINERVVPLAQNAMPDYIAEYFESDPDMGLIIHVYTMNSFPFHYSKTNGFEFVAAHSYTQIGLDAAHRKDEYWKNYICSRMVSDDTYQLYYKPIYTGIDEFNEENAVFIPTGVSGMLKRSQLQTVTKYITERYQLGWRIIFSL